MLSQRRDDFEQRLIASTLPHDPTLTSVSKLLSAQEADEHIDEDQIFYPSSAEEFEQMIQLWDVPPGET